LRNLRRWSKHTPQRSEEYLRPGDIKRVPKVPGVKVYVLGPPRDRDDIKSEVRKGEMYPELAAWAEGSPEADSPFNSSCRLTEEEAREDPFFRKYYGFGESTKDAPDWRRITADWLASAADLAIRINNKTNNTSLVLAIELAHGDQRQVLLFPGDAQIGNWLSWPKIEKWQGQGVVNRLLKDTVLYKVAHHGSLNATPKQQGLELMTNPGLVAMLPVDARWAKNKSEKKSWEHPAKNLLSELMTRCCNRVLRADEPAVPCDGPEWQPYSPPPRYVYTKTDGNPEPAEKIFWVQLTFPSG
jgi:hypothetical protein